MPKPTVTKTTSTTTNSDGEDRTVEQYRKTISKGIAEAIDDTARALLNAALDNVVDDYEEGDLSVTGRGETA